MAQSFPVLVVGADSTIGAGLLAAFQSSGRPVIGTSRRRERCSDSTCFLDLADAESEWRIPANIATAILCAAVTSQSACSLNPEETAFINVVQTVKLARQMIHRGVKVVLLSTNLVFDGRQPVTPADAPRNPQTEYGRQKALVEDAFRDVSNGVCVVRLTKVFSPRSLPANWVSDLHAGNTIRAFHDLPVSPVSLPFVIDVLRFVVDGGFSGVVQVGASDEISYADVAHHLARTLGCDPRLVEATSARTVSQLDHVPDHASLDTSRLRAEFGITPPTSLQTVDAVLDMLRSPTSRSV